MEGLKNSTPRRLRALLSFLALKGYLRKSEHAESDSVSICPLLEKDARYPGSIPSALWAATAIHPSAHAGSPMP